MQFNEDELYSAAMAMGSDEELAHYGMPRRSGRYPWGSGEHPFQRMEDFMGRIKSLRDEGLTDTQIARELGLTTTEFRKQRSLALTEMNNQIFAQVKKLDKEGFNHTQIAEKLGLSGESQVRYILKGESNARRNIANNLAENLKKQVDEKGMIDVGKGTNRILEASENKMKEAIAILEQQGYEERRLSVPQATNPGQRTRMKVLVPPGTPKGEEYKLDKIHTLEDYTSRDGGDTLDPGFRYPSSLDSKRLEVKYVENGGKEKDGLVEIRRGVPDLSLGTSNYAQVRILVDGTHYIKGMAVYKDPSEMPDGVDVIFNTNKPEAGGKMGALKKIKADDPTNPFGSSIKEHGGQSYYDDPNGEYTDPVTGNKQSLSKINKRADEGDWGQWSNTLPSQFLSKQNNNLIKRQLDLSYDEYADEYQEIMSLTNPTVRKYYLSKFAENCDSAAIQMKAAALPGQKYQVILPVPSLRDNEVYAPNFRDGQEMALIRYPHAGTFEIPIVVNNTRNKEGQKTMSTNPNDAIGVNAHVASILSGADFDGDTVMVIPLSDKVKIRSREPFEKLANFDNKLEYGPDPSQTYEDDKGVTHYVRGGREYRLMDSRGTQMEMGKISNLITDMTLMGAEDEELIRAVRHSMVVIDAEKHHLDYKQSEADNGIKQLHAKYQGGPNAGAATLISKSEVVVPEMKEGAFFAKDTGKELDVFDEKNRMYVDTDTGQIYRRNDVKTVYVDPDTGKKLYHQTNRSYKKVRIVGDDGSIRDRSVAEKDGVVMYKAGEKHWEVLPPEYLERIKTKYATSSMPIVGITDDVSKLSSNTKAEQLYSVYVNNMKELANKARKEELAIKETKLNLSAAKAYADEVQSLKFKQEQSIMNAQRERAAQRLAAVNIEKRLDEDGNRNHLTSEQKGKLRQQEISKARVVYGAKRNLATITDKEVAAINAGAIGSSVLRDILSSIDQTELRKAFMPKDDRSISTAKQNRIAGMARSGYTNAQIADALGISVSTVIKYTKEEN